jgi:hypothetical protein
MQLTRFDRWLREKYVYQTHIQTLRPPDSLPDGIIAVDLAEEPGKRYKYLFIAKREKIADAFIAQLKENGQMFVTQIVDSDAWYVRFMAPKNKSLTWSLVSIVLGAIIVICILLYLKGLTDDPELRKNFIDVLKMFKN